MAYLYETHLHTCLSSACGRSTGREHARYYHSLGFQGIFVTDHFFGGNTAIPREWAWDRWVRAFCRGYEEAKDEGDRIGLDVFFGWEQGYGDDEYLIYGLDQDWLLAHPAIAACPRAEQMRLVHEGGGCVIQAHPFRTRDYIRHVRLGRRFADGVEAANAANAPANDAAAYRYAREYGMVMTAGSDNHLSPAPGQERAGGVMGVSFEHKLSSARDYAARVLGGDSIGLYVPADRFDPPREHVLIQSFWLDRRERLVPTNRDWLKE